MLESIQSFGNRNRDTLSRFSISILFLWCIFMIASATIGSGEFLNSGIFLIGMPIVTICALAAFFLGHPTRQDRMKVKSGHLFGWLGGQILSLLCYFYIASLA